MPVIKDADYAQSATIIDINGPDGNAYALFGYVATFGCQLGWEQSKINAVIENMKSRDYNYLVSQMNIAFGDVITFVTSDDELCTYCTNQYDAYCAMMESAKNAGISEDAAMRFVNQVASVLDQVMEDEDGDA